MGILTEDMKRVVPEQRLGFVATVCPDGTPNLSPKGTTAVWDDDHIVFADIRSPSKVSNLRRNPSTEINLVDPMVRKGYRFKGVASALTEGACSNESWISLARSAISTKAASRLGHLYSSRSTKLCRSFLQPTIWARAKSRCERNGSATLIHCNAISPPRAATKRDRPLLATRLIRVPCRGGSLSKS